MILVRGSHMIHTMADQPPPKIAVPVTQISRFKAIAQKFEDHYGRRPTYFARAPGRVNLIGEHIDYNGYAVLPMAIEQDIVIAVAPNDSGKIKLANTDSRYPDYQSRSCLKDISIDHSTIDWYKYFLCGFKGLLEHAKIDKSVGMDLILDGTIPRSAGLSSSSAFVCCAALSTMVANNVTMTKKELAELCQECEKYIGTEGGGMDQAISFLAESGTAKYVEFNPLRATDVKLPDGAVFVISNSCVEMNKAATSHFNIRVSECRLAAQILAKSKSLPWKDFRRLGDLQERLGVSLDEMLEMVENTLDKEPYTKEKVCMILEVEEGELNRISLTEKSWHVDAFKLYDRAHHAYNEAGYVQKFKAACDANQDGALFELGRLMSASHTTCSKMYECSCDELDQLTALALNSGALGSRLTGAGWGGCAVSLVPSDSVETFLQKMKEGYYDAHPQAKDKISEALFATQPGAGAAVYTL